MGEYAEYQLARAGGSDGHTMKVERFPKLKCPCCGAMFGGAGTSIDEGLKRHMWAKHDRFSKVERASMVASAVEAGTHG